MAHEIKLVHNDYKFDLIFPTDTADQWQLLHTSTAQSGLDVTRYNTSEGTQVSRVQASENVFFLDLFIGSINEPDREQTIRQVAEVFRLIGSDAQRAAGFWTVPALDKIVEMHIKLDGSDLTTVYDVVYGDIQNKQLFTALILNQNIDRIGVELHLRPHGRATSQTLLSNCVDNPTFEYESSVPGIPTNWSVNGVSPVNSIVSDVVFVGKQSFKMEFSATESMQTSSCIVENNVACYCIIHVESGEVEVRIRDITPPPPFSTIDSAVIDSTDSNSVSDLSWTDAGGRVWYRVPLTGALSAGARTLRFQIFGQSVSAVAYLSAVYMAEGTTIPSGFVSNTNIFLRGDVTPTNATRINYIDLWGINGDSRADLSLRITPAADMGANPRMILGAVSGNKYNAQEYTSWQFAFAVLPGGFVNVVDASRLNGDYYSLTGASDAFSILSLNVINGTRFLAVPRRIFAICRSTTTAAGITCEYTIGLGDSVQTSDTKSVTSANTWEIVDLGIVSGSAVETSYGNSVNVRFSFTVTGLPAANTFDVDAVFFMPSTGNLIVIEPRGDISSTVGLEIIGGDRTVSRVGDEEPFNGRLFSVPAGDILTRIFVLGWKTLTDFDHTLEFDIEPRVTAKTRYLIGTK